MVNWIRCFAAFVLLSAPCWAQIAAAAKPAAAPALQLQATPALWKIKGVHGTVYLFGTVHVMKPEVVWETPKIKSAFGASDTIYTEIANLDDDSVKAMQPVVMEIGLDPTHPLSTKISKEDVALLDKVAQDMGAPGEAAFEPMKPWLVYMTLSVLPMMKSGYDQKSGIDMTLGNEAKETKKTAKGFETITDQLHLLADFPEPEQVALLHEALTDLPKSTAQMDEVVADWTRGDVEKIASIDNDELKAKHPALYDKLLVKRNERFADAIAGLLKDPATGTVFVAVGAGHLAGPDSVNAMLTKKGFTITREQ